MAYLFSNCKALSKVNLDGFDSSKADSLAGFFEGCSSLLSIDLGGFDTSNVTNMRYMFRGCSKLEVIYVSSTFVTTKVTDSTYMFLNCASLVGGNGTTYNSSNTSKTYARIDTASTPGYFTAK